MNLEYGTLERRLAVQALAAMKKQDRDREELEKTSRRAMIENQKKRKTRK